MVNVKGLIRQANDLHERADDPSIRDRLNRMAETYSHIAEIEACTAQPSVHGLMDALTHPPGRSRNPATFRPTFSNVGKRPELISLNAIYIASSPASRASVDAISMDRSPTLSAARISHLARISSSSFSVRCSIPTNELWAALTLISSSSLT